MSYCVVSDTNIFFRFANAIILLNSHVSDSSFLSLFNAFRLNVNQMLFESLGLFIVDNVKEINFEGYQSYGVSSRTILREFEQFSMNNSVFTNSIITYPPLVVEFGNNAQLTNVRGQYNYGWAVFRYVKNLYLNYCQVSNNIVLNPKMRISSPTTITHTNLLSITNSIFNQNTAISGGSLYIDEFINVNIFNNIFTNCVSNDKGGAIRFNNFQQVSIAADSNIKIFNNTFEDNVSFAFGGAVAVYSSFNLYVKNNIFRRNIATVGGGALAVIAYTIHGELESYFEENRVLLSIENLNNSQINSESVSWYMMGIGGACLLNNNGPGFKFVVAKSVFIRNSAAKGGAIAGGNILPQSLLVPNFIVQDCTFMENYASKTGSAVHFFKPIANLSIISNANLGDNQTFSSSPTLFEITYGESVISLFPGQTISLSFNLENIFGKSMNVSGQNVIYECEGGCKPLLQYSLRSNTSLLFTPFALSNDKKELNSLNLTLYSEDMSLQKVIAFTLTECNQGFILESVIVNSQIVYQCVKDTKIDLSVVIGVTVPLGIVVLLIGIILGSMAFYIVRFVIKQVKTLKRKEKAEKSLELRIVDKQVVFGSQNTKRSYISNRELTEPLIGEEDDRFHTPSFIIPIESIEIIRKLAEGGLGIIYLGKLWKKINVAIKLLKSNDQEDEFEREVSLLSSLRHDNIVTFYGICVSDESKYMITEYVEMGSLDRTLYKARINEIELPLYQKISILLATSKGIEYLHNLDPIVVHRDLKPGNILMDEKNIAKICDFGLSRVVSTTTMQSVMTTNLGTLFYCPSEVIKGQTSKNKASKLTASKIDVYSFAIMWEVFFELIPYSNSGNKLKPLFEISQEHEEALSVNAYNIPSSYRKNL